MAEMSEMWRCHLTPISNSLKDGVNSFTYIIKVIVGSNSMDFNPDSACSLLYVTWANYSTSPRLSFPTDEMRTRRHAHLLGTQGEFRGKPLAQRLVRNKCTRTLFISSGSGSTSPCLR